MPRGRSDTRQNHWFDALYNASAASRYCGAKLLREERRTMDGPHQEPPARQWTRPYFDNSDFRFSADMNFRSGRE
jgi:hypothetical protein